nr:unnamed protein product [Callosobruchus chinensis]
MSYQDCSLSDPQSFVGAFADFLKIFTHQVNPVIITTPSVMQILH